MGFCGSVWQESSITSGLQGFVSSAAPWPCLFVFLPNIRPVLSPPLPQSSPHPPPSAPSLCPVTSVHPRASQIRVAFRNDVDTTGGTRGGGRSPLRNRVRTLPGTRVSSGSGTPTAWDTGGQHWTGTQEATWTWGASCVLAGPHWPKPEESADTSVSARVRRTTVEPLSVSPPAAPCWPPSCFSSPLACLKVLEDLARGVDGPVWNGDLTGRRTGTARPELHAHSSHGQCPSRLSPLAVSRECR